MRVVVVCSCGRRLHRHQARQQRQRQTRAPAPAPFISPTVLLKTGDDAWPQITLITLTGGSGGCQKLAEELMAVVIRLVRSLGRRGTMQLTGSVLAAVGLSDLSTDDTTRLVLAVESPSRVDAKVVQHLATMLAHAKRLEDAFGPCQVFETVSAQHRLLHQLLKGGCPE
jgi:hypothetical protein